MVKLISLNKIDNEDKKFNIFYFFRFHQDYLKQNICKKKISKKKFKLEFQNIKKVSLIYLIYKNNVNIGLIYYNKKNYYYFIVLKKKYRNEGFGKIALEKFIKKLKKKKNKLKTLVKIKNRKSIYIHNKICKTKKRYNKDFMVYNII